MKDIARLFPLNRAANVMDENVNIPSLVVHRKIYKMKTISEILDMAASGNNMVNKMSLIFFYN
jgi:hypothetical protein